MDGSIPPGAIPNSVCDSGVSESECVALWLIRGVLGHLASIGCAATNLNAQYT